MTLFDTGVFIIDFEKHNMHFLSVVKFNSEQVFVWWEFHDTHTPAESL